MSESSQWPFLIKRSTAIKRSTGDKTVYGLPWLDKTAIAVADKLIVRDNIEFATRSSNLDVWPFGCFCLDKTDKALIKRFLGLALIKRPLGRLLLKVAWEAPRARTLKLLSNRNPFSN